MNKEQRAAALRLADALLEPIVLDKHAMQAADLLRALAAEPETEPVIRAARDYIHAHDHGDTYDEIQTRNVLRDALDGKEVHHLYSAAPALKAEVSMNGKQAEPVAWQWVDTAHFRRKVPADADPGDWRPLYAAPVATENTSPERVAETAKREHEPYPVGWLDGPYAEFRRNHLWTLDPWPPKSIAWSIPLYTAVDVPPQREPLTDKQIYDLADADPHAGALRFARAIERHHGIGGKP